MKQSAFFNLSFSAEIFKQRNGAAINKDYIRLAETQDPRGGQRPKLVPASVQNAGQVT